MSMKDVIADEYKKYNVLCLSGGGNKGVCHLGALHYAYKHNILDNVDVYISTSVGSLIACMLSVGYTPIDIFTEWINNDMSHDIKNFNLLNLSSEFSLCKYEYIEQMMEEKIKDKVGFVPTLDEIFQQFEKHLIFTTYNYTLKTVEYVDRFTHPSLSCIKAVKMSSSLPIIFPPVKYNNYMYIDGGLGDNFPISLLDDGKNKILGLRIVGKITKESSSIIDYIRTIISIPYKELENYMVKNISPNCSIIKLEPENINNISVELTSEQKYKMFFDAFKKARTFFRPKLD